jgi:hypothetical protein
MDINVDFDLASTSIWTSAYPLASFVHHSPVLTTDLSDVVRCFPINRLIYLAHPLIPQRIDIDNPSGTSASMAKGSGDSEIGSLAARPAGWPAGWPAGPAALARPLAGQFGGRLSECVREGGGGGGSATRK